MLEAFLWWFGGCIIAWYLIKFIEIVPAYNFQSESVDKILLITFTTYDNVRENIIQCIDYMLQNNVFTEEEANAKVKEEMLKLHEWGDSMISLITRQTKSGRFPYKFPFSDWKGALEHRKTWSKEKKDIE